MSTTRIKQLAVVLATSSIAFVLIEQAPAASAHEPHVAARPPTRQMPAIVLVHGAFTDASGWADVIHILLKKGFNVTAVQNPLTGYAQDVATTRRLIAAQTGPVVVVGHAYGGAVITSAAAGNPHVRALVFVAAFAPDSGEAIDAYDDTYPSALRTALRGDAEGFMYIDRASFRDVFARDLSASEAGIMAAAQKPADSSDFDSSPNVAAWRTIPSWYVVAQDDHAINPQLERFFAMRMRAHTTEIKSSHVVYISHPEPVAAIIEEAALVTAMNFAQQ